MTNFAQMLKIISRAWGRNQEGYCFFPWIDREAQLRTGQKKPGFHEGPAFEWPADRAKIIKHLEAHQEYDLYWCPNLFEFPVRRANGAMDEHALWADLDAVDPRTIEAEYEPTIAWETSPGSYQALWIISQGDIMGASGVGKENHRLSYYLGADPSGWDTTQLLRIPGTRNFKPERRDKNGRAPQGRLLWHNRRTYLPDEFDDLPEVERNGVGTSQLADVMTDEIELIDKHAVISRIKLKLNHKARELLYAREVSGDRSDNLWYLTRCLADVGCTVAEIVSITRESVWNKFDGRADEMRRLIAEASKAIQKRDPNALESVEEDRITRPRPTRLATVLKNVKPPSWLIKDIWTVGGLGFISGEPKSFKSWVALDLALSVSTGAAFLSHFHVLKPGPVLYIQEEDSAVTIKDRSSKVWKGKGVDRMVIENGQIFWLPPSTPDEFDPDVDMYDQQGFVLSEGPWQEWLDETLADGMPDPNGGESRPYVLVIIDTLMNVAGDVEDKPGPITNKMLKPLKLLARKHTVAVVLVNHMRKSGEGNIRGGQRMLGSTAFHAWSEDALYLTRGKTGDVLVERESKSASDINFKIGNLMNEAWEPAVMIKDDTSPPVISPSAPAKPPTAPKKPGPSGDPKALKALQSLGQGQHTIKSVANAMGGTYQQAYRQLSRLLEEGEVARVDNHWQVL